MHCQDGLRVHDPRFVLSEVYRRAAYGRNHPLAIARVETAVDLCRCLGWLTDGAVESPTASAKSLARFHARDYIAALHDADSNGHVSIDARRRYNIGTMENPVFSGVFERASTAVGGSILAARLALEGRIAYHPAGGTHHAKRAAASGFCYFNDPVFAVLTMLEAGADRVLYVDLDAHHGDGVEDAFADDPRVFTISIHEDGRWPGTGKADDRRAGRARNMPVPQRINDSEFHFLIDEAVLPLAQRSAAEAMVITAGADPLKGDPLSKMELSNGALCDAVMKLCRSALPTVVLGGGGYNPWTLARYWAALWARLAGKPIPETLPEDAHAILAGLSCDLVDEDEVDARWLTTLLDPPNLGPVRPQFASLCSAMLAR
jgi:acetoin utilization protein AcuC